MQGVALAKLASVSLLTVKRSNCGAWVVGQDRTGILIVAFFKLIFETCDFILKTTCKVIQTMLYLIHQVKNTTKKGRYKIMDKKLEFVNVTFDEVTVYVWQGEELVSGGTLIYDYEQKAWVFWVEDTDDGITYFESLEDTEREIEFEQTHKEN